VVVEAEWPMKSRFRPNFGDDETEYRHA